MTVGRTGGAMSAEMSKLSVMTSAVAPAAERVTSAGCAPGLRTDKAASTLSAGTCSSAARVARTPPRKLTCTHHSSFSPANSEESRTP